MQEIRLAVLADTHGNLPALEAVLADIGQRDVDHIVVAGDLVGGPNPIETIRLLRFLDSWMIRGNSDTSFVHYAIGQASADRHTHLQYALLRWGVRQLDTDTLDFIRSLPEQRVIDLSGTVAIRVVHGSPRDLKESIYPDRDSAVLDLALMQITEPVIVCGHTHIPWVREQDGRLALNPGAVCGPLNGDTRAQYALLTWQGDRWQVEHRAVPYDLRRIRADFEESGLLEEGGALARSFLLSIETGQNVAEDFLSYAYRLVGETGFENCTTVPDDIWVQAAETFDWMEQQATYDQVVDDLREAYDRKAQERDSVEISPWKIEERQRFLSLLREEGKRSLLEIGAGTGVYSKFFQDSGLEVIATDLSPKNVRLCREKGLTAYVMDFLELEFPPCSFDAIYALNCLLHVPKRDLPSVLQAIRGLLKPGGLFYLGVYGGKEYEGVYQEDDYEPKRFFSFFPDERIEEIVTRSFELVDFRQVPLKGDEFHFQALILRRGRDGG